MPEFVRRPHRPRLCRVGDKAGARRPSVRLAPPRLWSAIKEGSEAVKAIWKGVVLAESDDTVVVEGNHYFPEQSLNMNFFRKSFRHSLCLWKGVASYYTVEVDGERNENAAWYYPKPSFLARRVKGRVAFHKGVRIEP